MGSPSRTTQVFSTHVLLVSDDTHQTSPPYASIKHSRVHFTADTEQGVTSCGRWHS